jgi:hypothetical protein
MLNFDKLDRKNLGWFIMWLNACFVSGDEVDTRAKVKGYVDFFAKNH